MLIPGKPVPSLGVDTLRHGRFDLSRDAGPNGSLLIFYRGLHCPLCIRQMTEFDVAQQRIEALGISALMVSADGEDRARQTSEKAGVTAAKVGYGLSLHAAREDWGLAMSSARDCSTEPDFFPEPGIFFVAPDQTLYFAWVQTSPFARPLLDDVLGAIRFRLDKNYPPRGMYDGPLPME